MRPYFRKRLFFVITFCIYTVMWIFLHYHETEFKALKEMSLEKPVDDRNRLTFKNETSGEEIQKHKDKHSNEDRLLKEMFCRPRSIWYKRYFPSKVSSDFHSWTFEEKQDCSNISSAFLYTDIHPKFSIDIKCDRENVEIKSKSKTRKDLADSDVFFVEFSDTCLEKYINTCCKDVKPVPNVVHYVSYDKSLLEFYEFVSLISVIRFVKPCAILIHGNKLPLGQYWNFVLALFPNIIHVHRDPPSIIFGNKVLFKAHSGDLMRIEALIYYGGIYLDTDSVVVKSLDSLRKYPFTMSLQGDGIISSAFIMAEKNATFLQQWLNGYRYDYKSKDYIYNAMIVPSMIARRHEELINVEFGKMSRPMSQKGKTIFHTNMKWNDIFGMHLFSRVFNISMNIELVKHFNTTVGSICRHVLFGNKELCFS